MVNETRKILEDDTIGVSPTTVRVPVVNGHSESIYATFHRPMRAAEAREALAHCDLCAHQCGVDRRIHGAGRCHAGPGIQMKTTAFNSTLLFYPSKNPRLRLFALAGARLCLSKHGTSYDFRNGRRSSIAVSSVESWRSRCSSFRPVSRRKSQRATL